jgi:hypothetical protein
MAMGPCLCGDPACPNCFPGGEFVPSDQACKAVEHLLDVVTRHHTYTDGETFVECELCGGWDDHADDCPVPVLLTWQKAGAQ